MNYERQRRGAPQEPLIVYPKGSNVNKVLQYCAKVMRANFGEIQRTSTNFSENGRYFEQNEASSICERIFKAAIVVICSKFRFNTRTVAWYFERFFVEDNESSRGVFRIIAKSFEFSLVLAEVPAKIRSPLETLWIALSIPSRAAHTQQQWRSRKHGNRDNVYYIIVAWTARTFDRKFSGIKMKIRKNKGRISSKFALITFAQYCICKLTAFQCTCSWSLEV